MKINSRKLEEKNSKFILYDQYQELLLPKSVQEFIPRDHPARAVSHIVDSLDISCVVETYDHRGAPAYDPRMMMKVLVYSYLTGTRGSRRIAALLNDSLAFMYLSGGQNPDFRTICRFRREHNEKIEEISEKVVEICKKLDMVGGKDAFLDGTKIKANASVGESKTQEQIEKEIEDLKKEVKLILEEAEKVDREEDLLYGDENPYTGTGKIPSLLKRVAKLEKIKLKIQEGEKINTTDPEACIMQFSDKTKKPAYNGEIAVDGKENVICACRLTDEATDHSQLQPLMEQVEKNVGIPENTGADSGFFSYDNAVYLEGKGTNWYIPDNFWRVEEKKKNKKFRKSQFTYNEESDSYTCPAQNILLYHHTQKREGAPDLKVYRGINCPSCHLKEKCTKAEYRTLSRDPREYLIEEVRQRLKTEKGKQMRKDRSAKVEAPFGNSKYNKKFTHFLLRGKKYAGIEFTLLCVALNIEKIYFYTRAHGIDLTTILGKIT